MTIPKSWRIPFDKVDFEKDPYGTLAKAFASIEEAYATLNRRLPTLPDKGDLYVGLGAGLVGVLTVGDDGDQLEVDDEAETGLAWVTPA